MGGGDRTGGDAANALTGAAMPPPDDELPSAILPRPTELLGPLQEAKRVQHDPWMTATNLSPEAKEWLSSLSREARACCSVKPTAAIAEQMCSAMRQAMHEIGKQLDRDLAVDRACLRAVELCCDG